MSARAPCCIVILAVSLTAVSYAAAPVRVVAVGGAVTEIVYALGAQDRLVAVDTTSTFPKAATKLPSVGYQRALSAEGVLAMAPQAVIGVVEAGPASALAQIRAAGVPLTIVPSEHTLESLRARVRAVADTLGIPEKGEALDRRIVAEWQESAHEVASYHTSPRVLFLLTHAGNSAMVAGEGTAADAMIRLAGGTNAAAGVKGYNPLTAEAVVIAKPNVVLITREGLDTIGGTDAVWTKPGMALTPAAANRRVVAIDALYLLGFGPRTPQAVRELAMQLHAH
jgi:iron complex transport system substrate-binding protein